MKTHSFENPTVVSEDQWLAARRELLREEKELTRMHDRIAARRRELPWVKVAKAYTFDAPSGPISLAELFNGRSQLAIYHFMLGPDWEEGCPSCSYIADHLVPTVPHLQARDVSLAVVSRAPLAEILPFKERMGWSFNWVSSHRNDFNYDYHVSFTEEEMGRKTVFYNFGRVAFPNDEAPGFSVFAKDVSGNVFHTYSTYGRGVEQFMGTYTILDLMPKGRDEDPANPHKMDWVRHHDRYDQPADVVAAR
ncbi:MAG TPA: thioredoxin family protein [Opitutus sp.]|nr:thioredoxin family protein [Opitutus sp.]